MGDNNGHEDEEIISWFEEISEHAARVQTETLQQIIQLNLGVEYLKCWLGDLKIQDMDPCTLESLYTSSVPLASHSDFEPYIQSIADGDPSPDHLLTQEPITTLSLRYLLTSSFLLRCHKSL